jgi:hypothetical protein
MKKFIFPCITGLISLALFSSACNRTNDKVIAEPPVNYVVLIDLSDRLIHSEQAAHDIAQIEKVFAAFTEQVKQHLYILSEDRFQVRIIPQKGSSLHAEHYENALSIDMKTLEPAEKGNQLDKLSAAFPTIIQQLYAEAILGQKTSDYPGVDIWKYFKYRIADDLPANYRHKVIVLTDGYFDFEDISHVMQEGNRYTHSGFLKNPNLQGLDWRKYAEQNDFGYIPVDIPVKVQVAVSGLRPKSELLIEEEKLKYFWNKWLIESCGTPGFFIADASATIMTRQLSEFLSMND